MAVRAEKQAAAAAAAVKAELERHSNTTTSLYLEQWTCPLSRQGPPVALA